MSAPASPRVRARIRDKRCYELAARGQMRAPAWTLVHGRVTFGIGDEVSAEIPHAWLEHNGTVYDAVQDRFFSIEEYERQHNARAKYRYTPEEAASLMRKLKVYGPFDPYL